MYSWLWMKKRILVYVNIRFGENNEFLIIVWISSDAFELDANIANFVYYGKTRLWLIGQYETVCMSICEARKSHFGVFYQDKKWYRFTIKPTLFFQISFLLSDCSCKCNRDVAIWLFWMGSLQYWVWDPTIVQCNQTHKRRAIEVFLN